MRPAPSGIVVIGDALLDRDIDGEVARICPDAPAPVLDETSVRSRPGGAALAAVLAAMLAGPDGPPVTLVTALCADDAGRELSAMVESGGAALMAIRAGGGTTEKIRLRSGGQTLMRLDRGTGPVQLEEPPPGLWALVEGAQAVLVADYGRGVAAHPAVRSLLAAAGRPIVWDPHPRGADPVPGCRMLTPNVSELLSRFAVPSPAGDAGSVSEPGPIGHSGRVPSLASLTAAARSAHARWKAGSVAVTRGASGALLISGDGPPLAVPATSAQAGDTCGAGDCFAASAVVSLAAGDLPSEAVATAVSASGRFVATGGASAFSRWNGHPVALIGSPTAATSGCDAATVVSKVRRAGGTVVAAGGCFDLLHAGHVRLLQSARQMGDCLIVCINSDDSVRRLKGPGRPLNGQADRASTLAALDCVDAVEIFDEDTPERVIRRLRPEVWVKGGDYDARSLPEAAILAEWGGQAAVLPYLVGRSTTSLLQRAAAPAS